MSETVGSVAELWRYRSSRSSGGAAGKRPRAGVYATVVQAGMVRLADEVALD